MDPEVLGSSPNPGTIKRKKEMSPLERKCVEIGTIPLVLDYSSLRLYKNVFRLFVLCLVKDWMAVNREVSEFLDKNTEFKMHSRYNVWLQSIQDLGDYIRLEYLVEEDTVNIIASSEVG